MDTAYAYFDNAAATPLDGDVLAAMLPFLTTEYYNPSANYGPAREVAHSLADARAKVAHWLGARPSEIIFTAGGTEADNLAVHGVMAAYPQANLVVGALEHEAILQPAGRYELRVAPANTQGFVSPDDVAKLVDDQTVLVSIMYANNEIGTIQPIREINRLLVGIRQARRQAGNKLPLYLHTDACQAANYLDLHVARLGVDMMTLNGGKMYGPKQSGVLYIKAGLELQPLVQGGGQERGLRSGTENVAAVVGLATALDKAQAGRLAEVRRLQDLQRLFIAMVADRLPTATVNGSLHNRLPNNIHLTFPGQDNERLLVRLEQHGVLAAAGSACSASSDEPSHVLRAIGLGDAAARSSLRFTMGRQTDRQAVMQAVDALVKSME